MPFEVFRTVRFWAKYTVVIQLFFPPILYEMTAKTLTGHIQLDDELTYLPQDISTNSSSKGVVRTPAYREYRSRTLTVRTPYDIINLQIPQLGCFQASHVCMALVYSWTLLPALARFPSFFFLSSPKISASINVTSLFAVLAVFLRVKVSIS